MRNNRITTALLINCEGDWVVYIDGQIVFEGGCRFSPLDAVVLLKDARTIYELYLNDTPEMGSAEALLWFRGEEDTEFEPFPWNEGWYEFPVELPIDIWDALIGVCDNHATID